MIEHGINTTTADYWVHLFPVELVATVYWYRVDHMREYLRLKNPPIQAGKSKDGSVTGAGYLVPKDAYFISYAEVPEHFVCGFRWGEMTDREFGFTGEHVVDVLIEKRVVSIPAFRLRNLRRRDDQFDAKDFVGSYFVDASFEAKTERVHSRNLFVQSQEGAHKVHLVSHSGEVSHKYTAAPGFEDDGR